MSGKPPAAGTDARRLAIEAVRRIDEEGAYANLLLPTLLERDFNLPPLPELLKEVGRIRELQRDPAHAAAG